MSALPFPALVTPDSVISIPLSQGQRAHFNARYWELLEPYSWYANKNRNTFYAVADVFRSDRARIKLKMHRLILGLTDPEVKVDHVDHNGLNNLDYNLRIATTRQNQSNLRYKPEMSSRYTGVCWNEQHQKWRAHIKSGGIQHFLGDFDAETDARDAYLEALAKIGEKPL